jgi:hypothetical protein
MSLVPERTVMPRAWFLSESLSVLLLLFVHADTVNTMSQNQSPAVPAAWLTHAEKTDYRETPSYAETIE